MKVVHHALAISLVAVVVAPAVLAAEAKQGSAPVGVTKTPAAPAPVPIPYPNLAFLPASCRPSVDAAQREVDAARVRLEEAKKKATAGSSQVGVDRALVAGAHAQCCLSYFDGAAAKQTGPESGEELTFYCRRMLAATKQSSIRYRSTWDLVHSCDAIAGMAADAAKTAAKGAASEAQKQALADLTRANEKLAAAERACANAIGAPSAAPGPSSAPTPPVGPNGACDASHVCGPALECREGKCRLPCACAAPCFAEGGECKQVVAVTRTVRKACAVCVPPCSKDGDGVCRSDTTELGSEKRSCAPVCP